MFFVAGFITTLYETGDAYQNIWNKSQDLAI